MFLDLLSEPGDVLTAMDLAAAGQVLQGEDLVVLEAPVSHSKRDAGGVLGCSPHHVGKDLGEVDGLPLGLLYLLFCAHILTLPFLLRFSLSLVRVVLCIRTIPVR